MRCNFYEYERKLQRIAPHIDGNKDVISMNMKENYNLYGYHSRLTEDVISMNMKENYN